MTIFHKFAAATLLLGTAPAFAAPVPQWAVDPARSTVGFSGSQTGTRFTGRFNRFKATVAFDPNHPESSKIAVVIELGTATTGDAQRDTALPGKDWFDVAAFPVARFVTTTIQRKGGNAFVAIGNLTLRGVTKQVALPFTLTTNGDTAYAKGHAQIVRTVFGVGQGPWSNAQWVGLDVGIDVNIVATRAH